MKKLTLMLVAVFACSALGFAQDGIKKEHKFNADKRGEMAERHAEMKEHFKAKAAEKKALHEEYAAAKTDAEKKAVEAKIKANVEADTNEQIAMFEGRVKKSEEGVKEAKKKLAQIKKDKKDINAKKAQAIKDGKFGPRPGMRGPGCDDGKCPFGPRGERGDRPEGPRGERGPGHPRGPQAK